MPKLIVNETEIDYLDEGAGISFAFSTGALEGTKEWLHRMPDSLVKSEFRVIRHDRRNTGKSVKTFTTTTTPLRYGLTI